jgi:hypothetical protein
LFGLYRLFGLFRLSGTGSLRFQSVSQGSLAPTGERDGVRGKSVGHSLRMKIDNSRPERDTAGGGCATSQRGGKIVSSPRGPDNDDPDSFRGSLDKAIRGELPDGTSFHSLKKKTGDWPRLFLINSPCPGRYPRSMKIPPSPAFSKGGAKGLFPQDSSLSNPSFSKLTARNQVLPAPFAVKDTALILVPAGSASLATGYCPREMS